MLLKTDVPVQRKHWVKKQEDELVIDEGLQRVVQSMVCIDGIFQENLADEKDEIVEQMTEKVPCMETSSEVTLSARHATSLSPAVRFLVESYGVDFFKVDGTGRHGRVLKSDILNFMAANNITEKSPKPAKPVARVEARVKVENVKRKEDIEQHVTSLNKSTQNLLAYADHATPTYQSPHLNFNSRCDATYIKAYAKLIDEKYQELSLAILICQGVVRSSIFDKEIIALQPLVLLINNFDGKKKLLKDLNVHILVNQWKMLKPWMEQKPLVSTTLV